MSALTDGPRSCGDCNGQMAVIGEKDGDTSGDRHRALWCCPQCGARQWTLDPETRIAEHWDRQLRAHVLSDQEEANV